MKMLFLTGVMLAIAGCATPPPLVSSAPTQRVEVPVKVPCIAAADKPQLPVVTRADPAKASRKAVAAATLADLRAYEKYAKDADAALTGCVAGTPAAPAR